MFLQQFALVFLASTAILWIIYKGDPKKVGIIALLIVCLSFFSLASTIAGFETSLFTKDQPYWKFYETPPERYFCIWGEEYIGDNSIAGSGALVCPVKNVSFVKYPIIETEQGFIPNPFEVTSESYFLFSRFDIFTGVYFENVMKSAHMGSARWVRLSGNSERIFEELDRIYDNNMLSAYITPSTVK